MPTGLEAPRPYRSRFRKMGRCPGARRQSRRASSVSYRDLAAGEFEHALLNSRSRSANYTANQRDVGTIVTIHRRGMPDRSSWTDRTVPKNLDPFKVNSTARPIYWARRQRVASRKLLVSTVCTMTSSGQARGGYQSNIN